MKRIIPDRLLSLIFLSICFGLSGCVGTVKDARKPSTKITSDTKADIAFEGIFQASPIAHDKIEVFFYPATGGTGKFDYVIQVGENPIPVSVPSEILLPDYRGLLKYTLTGLERGKKYFLQMEAYDQDGKAKSSNLNSKTATTFTNIVADFKGISTVSNAPGVDGLDSIKVRWTNAKMRYDNFGSVYEGNTRYYEVIVLDSTRHGPASLDNRNITASEGRWVKIVTFDSMVNETTINGLPSNTLFYVRVRAIHENTIDDVTNVKLRGELNSDYLTISTLNNDLSNISFKNFVTVRNSGIFQTNSMILSWDPITGVFEHLRLYWVDELGRNLIENASSILDPSISGLCNISADYSVPSCKKLLSSSTGGIVANLMTSTNYYFRLVACQDNECTRYAISDVITGNTFPFVASFAGLNQVYAAKTVSEIGTFTLEFEVPDLSKGYFDGLVVGFKEDRDAPDFYKLSEGEALPSDLNLTVEAFDYAVQGRITISGVDYGDEPRPYCFTLYPYVLNADGTKDTETYKSGYPWVCKIPELVAPTIKQFNGIKEASTTLHQIDIAWDGASSGIFSKCEIFIKKPSSPGIFNFATAILQYENYLMDSSSQFDYYRISYGPENSYVSIHNLVNGVYDIGMVSYHAYLNTPVRSQLNEQIFRCVVDSNRNDTDGNPLPMDCTLIK